MFLSLVPDFRFIRSLNLHAGVGLSHVTIAHTFYKSYFSYSRLILDEMSNSGLITASHNAAKTSRGYDYFKLGRNLQEIQWIFQWQGLATVASSCLWGHFLINCLTDSWLEVQLSCECLECCRGGLSQFRRSRICGCFSLRFDPVDWRLW